MPHIDVGGPICDTLAQGLRDCAGTIPLRRIPMALTATMRRFQLNLSDTDRDVYETIELRVAQHPSESEPYLVTRVLAMALEYRRDLQFGRGLSTPEEPGLSAPNAMGGVALWIEIGLPSAERLHKITKQADEVCVYVHKNPEPLLADLSSGTIHRAETIKVVAFAPSFLQALSERVERNNTWDVLRTNGTLYVTIGEETFETTPMTVQ
jgi:uncharacterized protein YaeQ